MAQKGVGRRELAAGVDWIPEAGVDMTVPNAAVPFEMRARVAGRSTRHMPWRAWLVVAALLSCVPSWSSARAQTAVGEVDLALVLAVDISHSVDWWEYRMQRDGLAYAIKQPEVVRAIHSGPSGRIAITVVQWSGWTSQKVVIPWAVLTQAEDTRRLSERVARMLRVYGGTATHIGGVIQYATRILAEVPFEARRKVIDVSGDGHDNISKQPGLRRDEAVAAGITINGLAIENEEKELSSYYRSYVIGGPGAFVIPAARYQDFGVAMKKKLIREISVNVLSRRVIRGGIRG
jgi:Protein of unknown function (DUF1194)